MSFLQDLDAEGAFRRGVWPLSGGSFACVVATLLLFQVVEKDIVVATVVVFLIEAALVTAIVSTVGRRFAAGFIAVIISMAIGTKGAVLVIPWGLPAIAAYHAVSSATASVANIGADSRRRSAWVETRRKDPPAPSRGQILINTVNECAARYRDNDTLNSYPADPGPLADLIDCQGLSASRVDNDTARTRFTERDDGWRWSYTPAAAEPTGRISGYSVRAFEDSALGPTSLQYTSDQAGLVSEHAPGKKPVVVATPVESLRLLWQCIARIPAEREKEKQLPSEERIRTQWRTWSNPIDEVLGRCPTLAPVVSVDYDARSYGLITLTTPGVNGRAADTVGVYAVELIPVDAKHFVYEVRATPRNVRGHHSGVVEYFVARDGSIRAR
jgi:hypothetical protein